MGWLFGRKNKIPQVPFVSDKTLDENALRFPTKTSPPKKIIKTEQIKAAAGFGRPLKLPEEKESFNLGSTSRPAPPRQLAARKSYLKSPQLDVPDTDIPDVYLKKVGSEPLYIKVDVYQRLLGKLEELKSGILKLNEIDRKLEKSEYNEENNFNKVKRLVKSMHDNLLQVDEIIFKSQGD